MKVLQLLCSRHYCPPSIPQLNYSESQSQNYVTTYGQSASLSWCQAPIWGLRPDFYYRQTVAGLLMRGAHSDERTGLRFTIAAGPRQRNHSCARVPQESWPYFTTSDSRLPQPGGSGPRIYISQEQGCPIIPPGTGFNFRRLLRLAGLRWRYSNQPPRGEITDSVNCCAKCPQIPRHGPRRKHISYIIVEVCLPRRCTATVAARTTSKTPFFYCRVRECCGRYLATAAV
jgi:hypothetical protein